MIRYVRYLNEKCLSKDMAVSVKRVATFKKDLLKYGVFKYYGYLGLTVLHVT